MKSNAKFAGQKREWPETGPDLLSAWSFERRPGGWIIATRSENGVTQERVRFFYAKNRQQFFAKLTAGKSTDFYGERIAISRGQGASEGASDYTAQFPGKVRKLLVQAGSVVTAQTPLIMVEAMKMEFAVKAATAGTVKKILVEEGMILTPGQKLLEFEETPGGP